MKKKFLKKHFLLSCAFVSPYFIWPLLWFLYSRILKTGPSYPEINLKNELIWPSISNYLLGTDIYGRSVFQILSEGLTYSLALSFVVTFFTCAIGVFVGYLMIRSRPIFATIIDLFTNVLFIFPSILLAIIFMSVLGNSAFGIGVILTLTGWASYARIARGEIKRVLAMPYVESAKAIGMGELRLFFKIVLPAISSQMIIHMVLGISGVIISEAVLGFLGLGGSEYSWGVLLSMSKDVLLEAPYLVTIISIVMAGLIIGLNLLGDSLRDILDPRES